MGLGSFWLISVVLGNYWSILVGNRWVLVVLSGYWWLLEVVGGFWWFLVGFGGSWWISVVLGGYRWNCTCGSQFNRKLQTNFADFQYQIREWLQARMCPHLNKIGQKLCPLECRVYINGDGGGSAPNQPPPPPPPPFANFFVKNLCGTLVHHP